MKTKKTNCLFILCVLISFVSCSNSEHYPKVNEFFSVRNNTDTTLIFKYEVSGLNKQDTILKNYYFLATYEPTDNKLWLSERELNNLLSKIAIFKVENNTPIYIHPKYYNKISLWNNYFENDYQGGWVCNQKSIEITAEMFDN